MPKSSSRKGRKLLVLVLLLAVVGGLTALAVLKKREPFITVQTEKVSRRSLIELVVANGRIQPVFQVKISPEVSGEIIELPVKEGQVVKKGDLLLKIKPDVYLQDRKSAEANFRGAEASRLTSIANLTKAEVEFRRIEALHRIQMVSDSDFVNAKAGLEIAAAQRQSANHQVEMAQASLRRADENLAKTTIASPLDGTISRLNSQLGERVVGTAMMAGTEVMIIADLNAMEARVDVGEVDVLLIHVGQKGRLEVDAFKDRRFSGTVTEIANSAKGAGFGGGSQDATKYEVKIRITEQEAFRPGMSVTAEIETRSRTNVLAVPVASVTTRLPKPPPTSEKPGQTPAHQDTNRAAPATASATTNPPPPAPPPSGSTNAAPTSAATANASVTSSTNAAPGRKTTDVPKHIEVVFVKEGDHAHMVPVKRGISDDTHTEIVEGLAEGQEVVSGGYKAISRELEDGKKIRVGAPPTAKAGEPNPPQPR